MKKDFSALWNEAWQAGVDAAKSVTPTPMVVGYPSTFMGNDIDYSKPVEVVNDGVCGFAWVSVKPGNSPLANWIKKKGYGRPDSYYGGVTIWISDYNQSMTRKEAHARAMAKVFREAGFEKVYSQSRMD